MKTILFWFWAIISISNFAQSDNPNSAFSTFHLGVLGGINFSSLVGTSIVLEGNTNLTSQLNLKLSLGYSIINQEEGYNVKTYKYYSYIDIYQQQFDLYQTESYTVDEINYYVFPLSIGIDYVFLNDRFSPYTLVQIGYNFYTYETTISNSASNVAGSYDTYDELPEEYNSEAPAIPKNDSYTIALGIGTRYKLSSAINLDLRYTYQFNKSLENTNQILVGFNF